MPELPEVETMRRGVAGVRGHRIQAVRRAGSKRLKAIRIAPRIDQLRRRVVGRCIEDVTRIGKRVVLQLDSNDWLVFEPRMTGLVLLAAPPNEEHLRLEIELSGGPNSQLSFWDRRGLGTVRLLDPRQQESQLGPEKLGPDALRISEHELRQRLGASRRAIKVALLDQRAVAGVGNLYASELLHRANVRPTRGCRGLRLREWQAIHESMVGVLSEAIRYEGSTLSDGTYRNALNESGGYQNHHQVYDRAGAPCPRCPERTIRRIVQCQRSTFYCPGCQR